tara:strand:+ start:1839 stop:2486 length:648 start_codon:yes stop_codon:yes gene_type:complete
MELLHKDIQDYASKYTENESKLLMDLDRETWVKTVNPRMISGKIQGRILSMFSRMIKPQNILEIGTFTGYSALCMAEGINKNGLIHTIDINEEIVLLAKEYFQKSKFNKNIKQYIGNAIDIIPKIKNNFDIVFIDADKENYSNYFDLVIKKVNVGGFIIADNVLWSGKVTKNIRDKETMALHEYNNKIMQSSIVSNLLLPVRDGLMICQKIKEVD